MKRFPFKSRLSRFFDIRPDEIRQVVAMASLFFFLLAAINVIKVVRDSFFLSRFPISHLPYVYLLAAFFGGVVIAVYTRWTSTVPLYRLILASNLFIMVNVIVFWFLLIFFEFAWAIYLFYVWAAIVSVLAVAQFWTLADSIFNSREAKRLFGSFAACGSLGAALGGFGSGWTVDLFNGTSQLFWLIEALFTGAFGVVWFCRKSLTDIQTKPADVDPAAEKPQPGHRAGAVGLILSSRYLQLIATIVFVSVVVSTLIDFQFKAAAKVAYPSKDNLTAFFGSYYAWLAIITFFSQAVLTRKLLNAFGLLPSLLLLPVGLSAGSLGILIWPGIFSTMLTRMTDAVLRTSVSQTGMEMLYLPLSTDVKRQVKTFIDVVLQRLGDAAAGLIVLLYVSWMIPDPVSLCYLALTLIIIWAALIVRMRSGYLAALRSGLEAGTVSWQPGEIDYADRQTIEAVFHNLQQSLRREDEPALLFALDLAEKLDPKITVPRLPLSLLHYPSPRVRARALKFFAASPNPSQLKEVPQLLQDENREVQAEAINVLCAVRKEDAIPIMRPYLDSPDPRVQASAVECLLHYGDPEIRKVAMASFWKLVTAEGAGAEKSRIEAAGLMGDINEPEFLPPLKKMIREDPAVPVIQEALAAAGKKKEPTLVTDVIMRLSCPKTKIAARQALIEYGELAVEKLRAALADRNVSRDIRLGIPRTLSKIASTASLNALLSALETEDGSIRYRVILGLEEMIRQSPGLHIEKDLIETAIDSEVRRYHHRFLTFFSLFGDPASSSKNGDSLLHQALVENMDREKERVLRLLSLVYRADDIWRVAATLRNGSREKQAQAIEFLDNLLIGNLNRDVVPLFEDTLGFERFHRFLSLSGLTEFSTETALRELLKQDDVWLKAATVWEIGLRGFSKLKKELQQFLVSAEPVLKETTNSVISRI